MNPDCYRLEKMEKSLLFIEKKGGVVVLPSIESWEQLCSTVTPEQRGDASAFMQLRLCKVPILWYEGGYCKAIEKINMQQDKINTLTVMNSIYKQRLKSEKKKK